MFYSPVKPKFAFCNIRYFLVFWKEPCNHVCRMCDMKYFFPLLHYKIIFYFLGKTLPGVAALSDAWKFNIYLYWTRNIIKVLSRFLTLDFQCWERSNKWYPWFLVWLLKVAPSQFLLISVISTSFCLSSFLFLPKYWADFQPFARCTCIKIHWLLTAIRGK